MHISRFKKAANENLPLAINNLGYCYLNDIGVNKDEFEAVKLFRKAANLN